MNRWDDAVRRFVDEILGEMDETTTSGAIATVPLPMKPGLRKGDGEPLTPPEDLPLNPGAEEDPALDHD